VSRKVSVDAGFLYNETTEVSLELKQRPCVVRYMGSFRGCVLQHLLNCAVVEENTDIALTLSTVTIGTMLRGVSLP
jgi:hypothetical protein